MKKKLLTYLVPIVLVIGTAFGAGMVVGDDWEDESDVEVGVEWVEPTIEWGEKELIYPEEKYISEGEVLPYNAQIYVPVEVEAPGHDTVVDRVEYRFWHEDKDVGAGDAVGELDWFEATIVGDWDEGFAMFEGTIELPDGENMWRYGESSSWTLNARVYYEDEDGNEIHTCISQSYGIEEHLNILWAQDGIAEEVEPGTVLNGDDFHVPGETEERPKINITSNANWELAFEDGVAYYYDEEDGWTDAHTLDVGGGYEEDSGIPTWEQELNLNYNVDVEHGQMHGQYSTEYGESVSHTLSREV